MHFGVLGPLAVHVDARAVPLGRRKQRGLLAMLLAARGATVPLDRLVDLLWTEEPPSQAIASLQAYVSNLRRLIEPDRPARGRATRLMSRSPGYALVTHPDEVDADRFVSLLDAARSARSEGALDRAAGLFDDALQLWRGPAYGEFAGEPFALADASRLEELRFAAREERLEVRLAAGRHASVIADAEAVVAEQPLREGAWAVLMVALYRSGRQADALRAFQRARTILDDQLGLLPGPRLRELEAQILAQSPSLDVDVGVGTAHVDIAVSPPGEPAIDGLSPHDLIGRSDELARLTNALHRAGAGAGRIVVVSGEAGVGKSALADALVSLAAVADLTVAIGRSPDTRDAPALWPWAQILGRLGLDEDGILDLGDDELAPVARRTQIVERVAHFVDSHPTVMVLDDIQWADGPTHHVLRLLADVTPSLPLLIVATRRLPADEDPALVETMAHLTRSSWCETINLSALEHDDGIALVRRTARTLPQDVVDQIYERSGGNPFYAVELARLAAAEGASVTTTVPTTVRDVVQRRLERLPEQAVAVLSVAAVLGTEIEPRAVAAVAGFESDMVFDALELGVVVGILTDDVGQSGNLRFAHDLLRAAIQSSLPKLRLARVHRAATEALVEMYGDSPAHVHSIARHALGAVAATGPAAAIDHVLAGGRASQWALDLDAAAEGYQIAADLLVAAGSDERIVRCRLLLARAQIGLLIHGRTPEVMRGFDEASLMAAGGGDEFEIVAALGVGSYAPLWGGFDVTAERAAWLRRVTGPHQADAASAACYLEAFAGWTGSGEHARERLASSIDTTTFGVGPAIRRGLLAVLDVLTGRPDDARTDAAAAIRLGVGGSDRWTGREPTGTPPGSGPWVAAWSGSFASIATALVAETGSELREIIAAACSVGGGIRFTDLVFDACSEAANALDGERTALDRLADRRRLLAAADDRFFGIPLAIVEHTCRSVHRASTTELRAEIDTMIAETRQVGWIPVVDARVVGSIR